ncbi:MAG: EAL domain-containing protein, partial [Colwellia sp.]
LKAKGYALAIDDFGTEYSNFERILDLDIDFLKIDARYIKDIDENKKSYEISRAIAFFAHNAGIPCIAEFVHSASVQTVVENLGINYSQGYYFSEPAPLPLTTE